jgi:hypothetical protein
MRVCLRHIRTGHDYNGDSLWVTASEEARDYASPDSALNAVSRERIDGMAMVIWHTPEGPEQVFELTTDSAQRAQTSSQPSQPPEPGAREGARPVGRS